MASSDSLLHGTLYATIFQARNLPCSFAKLVDQAVEIVEDLLHIDHCTGHSGLYATVDIGSTRVVHTSVRRHEPLHPDWNENFDVPCAHRASFIVISVKEDLPASTCVVGRTRIPVTDILDGQVLEGWFPLYNADLSQQLHKAEIHVRLQYQSVEEDPNWNKGVGRANFRGVQNVYFEQKPGCKVRLYQNSHLSSHYSPCIELGSGGIKHHYRPRRFWEELHQYINGAQHFVYVIGWSVNVNIALVRSERGSSQAKEKTLGELLKEKSNEGVRVLVLIWDDRTAIETVGFPGIMKTHCDETLEYFRDTNVCCVECPRNADPNMTPLEVIGIDFLFSHHQKAISLDAPFGDIREGYRTVVSFVGGIDLCDGRYDDEKHSLFRTLNTIHKNDFLQNNFKDASIARGGPRQPWHDTHCMIEGPAAYDVLTNFTQRWLKQSNRPELLLNYGDFPCILSPDESTFEDPERWTVQIFRSIDDSSVFGFPMKSKEAYELGLWANKNQVVDKSIEKAYIEAIRRAKNFIYIENQYFFGGCATWDRDNSCGCDHVIPTEIALKIVSKIKARERFSVYILTPMWPEGTPEEDTVQTMLHWFRNTVRMMYSMIGQALAVGQLASEYSPTDYLNFFCLGNREIKIPGEYNPPKRPELDTDYWNSQLHRRFPIYIHSKLMIVDDEYLIIGSANLNQRSMDGGRDTEIAQGCFQPEEINSEGRRARGDIFGYRLSLWHEHFASTNGGLKKEYLLPEGLECVHGLQRIAQRTWEWYCRKETIQDLPGHLLPSPISVLDDGSLEDASDWFFPDTSASVQGCKSIFLPSLLTT